MLDTNMHKYFTQTRIAPATGAKKGSGWRPLTQGFSQRLLIQVTSQISIALGWQAVTPSMTAFILGAKDSARRGRSLQRVWCPQNEGWMNLPSHRVSLCAMFLPKKSLGAHHEHLGRRVFGSGAGPALQPWASRGNVCHGDAWQGAAHVSDCQPKSSSAWVLVAPGAKYHFSCDGVRPLVAQPRARKPFTLRLAVPRIQILRKTAKYPNQIPLCGWVFRPGYMIHDRTLRAAKVGVTKWETEVLERSRMSSCGEHQASWDFWNQSQKRWRSLCCQSLVSWKNLMMA